MGTLVRHIVAMLTVVTCLACSGYLAYEKIVKQLLDGDYYAMYSPAGVDNTQVTGPLNQAAPSANCLWYHPGLQYQGILHQKVVLTATGFDCMKTAAVQVVLPAVRHD